MTTETLQPARAEAPEAEGGELLVLSPWMEVEHLDETAATIYLSSDGKRIKVPLALHRLLLRFRSAARPAEVCGSSGAAARTARAIAQLKDKGFLLAADAIPALRPRQVTDPPLRLFDAPAQKLAPAKADVVVLGVPWDFGDRDAAGARRGPQAIRDVSLQLLYRLDRESGRPLGWYDADRRRSILAGVSVADAGDVIVNHGEGRSAVVARLQDVLGTLTRDGALPVLLGGDSSLSFPFVDQCRRSGPLDVIQIGSPFQLPAAAGYLERLLDLPEIGAYGHVVPSGTDQGRSGWHRGYARVPIDAALSGGLAPMASRGDVRRVHVGIDVGALARAGDDPSRPSLSYRDVHALLLGIGRTCRIVSVDLCGLNPWAPCWGAVSMTALHLLLTALSAAKDPA